MAVSGLPLAHASSQYTGFHRTFISTYAELVANNVPGDTPQWGVSPGKCVNHFAQRLINDSFIFGMPVRKGGAG